MSTEEKRTAVAVVVGAGPGLGAALARRFAQGGYKVGLLARSRPALIELARQLEQATQATVLAVAADAAVESEIDRAFAEVRVALGDPEVLIYNPAIRPRGTLLETTPAVFEQTWRTVALGAFLCARAVVPSMVSRGAGVLLFSGATAGVKPSASSAAFGPAKFALRGLAQVLARDLGPKGVHVAYVNIDGMIDTPLARQRLAAPAVAGMLNPAAIAETYWQVAHQDRSAWTHELDLRPFGESF